MLVWQARAGFKSLHWPFSCLLKKKQTAKSMLEGSLTAQIENFNFCLILYLLWDKSFLFHSRVSGLSLYCWEDMVSLIYTGAVLCPNVGTRGKARSIWCYLVSVAWYSWHQYLGFGTFNGCWGCVSCSYSFMENTFCFPILPLVSIINNMEHLVWSVTETAL